MDGSLIVNRAPVAGNTNYFRGVGTSLKISITSLLAVNTSDADGNTVTLQSLGASTNGATITSDSTYIYFDSPNDNTESFTYTVADGRGGAATALITVQAVHLTGIAQNITVNGGSVIIDFAGIPGYAYDVQRSTDVSFTSPVLLETTNAPADGLFSFTDNSPPSPQAYYRLRQH
ncbi:MAG: hypothetical protein DME25_11910 [Verrucomicrobia bacterium]|nr:MAG: hypothetical protein DME25_11910 [Verrucomicrobiota bacterium]